MDGSTPLEAADLGRCFGFTPEEVTLNRAGRVSDRQRQAIVFHGVGYVVRGAALLVLIVTLAAAVAPTLRTAWHVALFAALCLLGLLIAGLLFRAAALIVRSPVRAVTGSPVRSGDARHPAITVGGVTLRISFRRWKRLPAALPGTYRAYYGPDTRLLSLEPAAKDD